MILVDMSQVTISNLMVHLNTHKSIDMELIRHMILNSLRSYRQKFFQEYGELVLCYDSSNTWRRDYFPQYKINRKKGREKSSIDWQSIFDTLHQIKEELIENFPYKVLQIEKAEADDIIGSIVNYYAKNDTDSKILIISGDKDFKQLQKHTFVHQYNPVMKKMIECEDPACYIKQHIMQGDVSDGIPNFLSKDNSIADGIRQSPLQKKKVANWVTLPPESFCTEEMLRNYQRNQTLIDLEYIPENIQSSCVDVYLKTTAQSRSKLLSYFVKNRLKNLMDTLTEF